MRLPIRVCLVLALNLPACSGAEPSDSAGTAGTGGTGSPVVGSTAGTTAAPSGGSASTGPAPVGAAGAFVKPAATGGGDDGGLFDSSMAVPFDPNAAGGMAATGGSGGSGGGIPGDGLMATSKIGGNVNGTAAFSQHGTDVTVVVKLTKCSNGTLGIHINDGDACDGTNTEGKPWDGKRGNIGDSGTIICSNGSASMTYTRSGSDPTLAWSVGDHNYATDLTNHVVIMSSDADGKSNFIGCGDFRQ